MPRASHQEKQSPSRSPVPSLLVAATLLLASLAPCPSIKAETCQGSPRNDRVPNIIVILADDQGYHDLGCQGATRIKTPNLDRMADEGTRLTDFYAQPVCGVSRAALLTGCYPIRVAEVDNTKSGHPVLHPEEITLAEVLKQRGYATALVGKWHLGGLGANSRGRGTGPFREELMPRAQGFDDFFGTPLHNGFTRLPDPKKFIAELVHNDELLESPLDMDLLTQKYTHQAVEFIETHRERPFFLYLAHNMPHVPLGASEKFRGSSEGGLYGDVIQEIDWSVGQVLDTLKRLELDRNTVVIYTSDNGPWVEEHLAGEGGIDAHYGSAEPLRGWKMRTYDGGLRVPCIAWAPGRIPAGRVLGEMISSMDLLPTFARLAGAQAPDDRILDGFDVWPVLADERGPDGAPAENPRQTFYYYCFNHLQAVRHGNWKLVLARPARPPWCSWSARMVEAVPSNALYDLASDVGEEKNVATEHPEVVAELLALIETAREDLGDYDRIGKGARFFDDAPRRPDATRWALPAVEDGGPTYPRGFTFSPAIDPEAGVTRRDPSDVIQIDGVYHVWYSKVTRGPDAWGYPSGYSADVFHATSEDGRRWTEEGLAVGKGTSGTWDEHGVFTPNILVADDRFFLFYTGVPRPFDENTKTAIGLAVADSPAGPWVKQPSDPVVLPSDDPADFDSMRVDDAAVIVRGGQYWLYYKGRQLAHSPGETRMGVALAERPEGPYQKHEAGPLHRGHEVMVWPQGEGVASLASAAGPRSIYFAADGLAFDPRHDLSNVPQAPGAFRADAFQEAPGEHGLRWGISHASRAGDLYLMRFDASLRQVAGARRGGRPQPQPYDNAPPVGNLRFTFETGELEGWRVVEGEFDLLVSDAKALPQWQDVPLNKQGEYHLSTVECADGQPAKDTMTGIVESPRFEIIGDTMSFLVGGGKEPDTYVALCDLAGEELLRAGGTNSPVMRRVHWDVSSLVGRKVFLRIVDRRKTNWAHVTFDDFSVEGKLESSPESRL